MRVLSLGQAFVHDCHRMLDCLMSRVAAEITIYVRWKRGEKALERRRRNLGLQRGVLVVGPVEGLLQFAFR